VAFRHTWTLALEEQFYIIWPALVMWVGRKRLIQLCLLIIVGAYAARAGLFYGPGYSLLILPARCDGFALGGLLAALLVGVERGSKAHRSIFLGSLAAATAAAIYIAVGVRQYSMVGFLGLPTPPDPGPTLLALNVLYFGIVGLVVCSQGRLALAPLRLRPLVYLGQISYGIYIYHYMVYWVYDGCGRQFNNNQPWEINILKVATTLVAAMISWELIERPILSLKDRFRYRGRPSPIAPRIEPAVAADAG
jgi:peptidoglycan/LPS O-acetylase OafA/YrhL